ncbi:MAG: S8 family serine peptidase, partial [Lentisphaeria bacterium]|nr:S8 family serine peptidase [Lentisphaeria bacterium]
WGPAAAGVFVPVSTGELEGMEYAGTNGRGGLGTVVASAAGNEDQTTSYQSRFHTGLEHVVCVAATNQFDLRSEYSNYGPHLTVAAPSNAIFMVPAIYTLEITGNGDVASDYTANFGGTSSATPVVSGVVGLIASAAPELTAAEIVQLLKDTADKIDPDGGFYDENGHSLKYGHGRVNALRALRVALGQTDRPWCETPAAEEDCDVHLDDNCDGFVDEGCTLAPALGTVCEQAGDCAGDFPWECPVTGQQRGLCTLACISSPCPAGSTCVEGRCSLDCETSDDCPTDFVCNKQDLGNCVPTCQTSADCAEGETCDLTSFLCRLDTDGEIGSPCGVPEDCINNGFCLGAGMGFPDGYCTRSCDNHSDCGGINRCVFVGGHGNFCYMGCSFDGDCRTEYLCEQDGPRAGTCYKLCERDDQCTGGDPAWDTIICDTESGRCIDTATEPDGGVDGGEEDGGALDAGEEDAGEVDAGEVDAGEVDAGEVDAGEVDAGEVDAGEVDAGQDAGASTDTDSDAGDDVEDGGGCGCGTQSSRTSEPFWFLLMIGLLVFTTSRKNRR